MIRYIYIADWFYESRYGTYIVVYAAGESGAWGGMRRLYWIIVRLKANGTLSAMTAMAGTDGNFANIRDWYGPDQELTEVSAVDHGKLADRIVTRFFPDVLFRSTTASLIQTAYG